jgi:hypothetical protein
MRRKILKDKYIFVILSFTAFFTFLSFFFDQSVVQQENNLRKMNSEISSQEIDINKNLFLINSIFNISKDLSYSSQIKKNTLDEAYSRHSLFQNPDDYSEKYKEKVLLSGVDGFKILKEQHDEIFEKVLINHNKKNDIIRFYIDNFLKNQLFNRAIEESEWDLSLLKSDLNKYYFSDEDLENLKELQKLGTNFDLMKLDEDPLYDFYSKAREKLNDLGYIGDLVYATGESVINLHFKNLDTYEKLLNNYSKIKNKKNLYILLSILFQILALTSLMFLFKIIINLEKK